MQPATTIHDVADDALDDALDDVIDSPDHVRHAVGLDTQHPEQVGGAGPGLDGLALTVGSVRVHLGWALAAMASIAVVGALTPAGLLLLGFLGVIILVHEAGHLFAARASGMKPTEYFWGFGPEVVSFERNNCSYGLRVLFLGGYVRLEGMTPEAELPDGFDEAGTYRAASHRGRLATILAGPFTNLVLAFAAVSAAELRAGRSAVAAAGQGLWFISEVTTATLMALGVWVANIGGYAQSVFGDTASAPVRFLSPVAQADVSMQAVESGLNTSLYWFALLSCAVGIVNLLPLPPLDGGHAVVAVAEGAMQRIIRRPVSLDVTRLVPLAYATVAVLVVLSATALVMDLRDIGVIRL